LSDYELTPEQELDLLRFQIGGMSIDEVLTASGPDWLIEGWLVSSATMVAGSPESGKSSLVAGMAAAVASGGMWLGEPVTTDRAGPVMILTSDPAGSGEWAQKGRDLEIAADDWEIYRFASEHWDDYVELASARSCRLLVFDNITSGVGGPINEADPSSVLGPLERVIAGGTPVVVIAHTGKDNSKDPMGPTAYKAWRRHGIHVAGSGDRPRKLTRAGNVGIWPDVVVNGTTIGSAVEYRLADGEVKSRPNRSSERLDQFAEITRWVVENCQGMSVNKTGAAIAAEFGGTEGARKTDLKQGTLSRMLGRTNEGGSTVWSLIK
jgi:AAA domain